MFYASLQAMTGLLNVAIGAPAKVFHEQIPVIKRKLEGGVGDSKSKLLSESCQKSASSLAAVVSDIFAIRPAHH